MDRTISTNRHAFFEYHVFDRYEAGIELEGAEVKSIRGGLSSIAESFIKIDAGQAFINNMYIAPYKFNQTVEIDSYRVRRLLLHKSEIEKISKAMKEKGFTVIPLKLYFNAKGYAKLEIAVAKGKKLYDKRRDIIKKEVDRKVKRQMKNKF